MKRQEEQARLHRELLKLTNCFHQSFLKLTNCFHQSFLSPLPLLLPTSTINIPPQKLMGR